MGMARDSAGISAVLPAQPAAGRLDYRIMLRSGPEVVVLPPADPAVIRFKGEVPLSVLIPHILAMFGAMLLSARAALGVFEPGPRLKILTFWTIGFLVAGGVLLGPLVQRYAFGTFWSGWPIGGDLTDNKTAVALLAWAAAAIALYRSKKPAPWVLAAAIILFAVYLIPHSVLGSDFAYNGVVR